MAWGYTPLNLQGQPGISPNWAAGIMETIDDNRAQKKAADVLLARKNAIKQATGPDGKFNSQNAAQYLLGAGDLEGGKIYGQLAENEADRAWREAQAERDQRNADRAYGLQAANAARGDWDIQSIKAPDGSETLVRVNRRDGTYVPLNNPNAAPGGAAPQGNGVKNPYYDGAFTVEQGKVAGYADRLSEAEAILSKPEIAASGTGKYNAFVSGMNIPDAVKNQMVSPEFQQYSQAQRNFINATLRRESGAVISPEEFANARQQYFPQPGDDEATLKQKADNRQTVYQSFARESGPNYRPRVQEAPQREQAAPEATKSLGGKNYIKINGQWFEQ
jgi:hypothetical protein